MDKSANASNNLVSFSIFDTDHTLPSSSKLPSPAQWNNNTKSSAPSLVDDMTSLLSIDSNAGLSDRLHHFAEEVKRLEVQVSEDKKTISRQEVRLQELEKTNFEDIVSNLRQQVSRLLSEKDALMVCIQSQRQHNVTSSNSLDVEPGFVTVQNVQKQFDPLQSGDENSKHHLIRRINSLEDMKEKLFQANKDWHNKWEQLRQSKQMEQDRLALSLKEAEENRDSMRLKLSSQNEQLQNLSVLKQKLETQLLEQREKVDTLKLEASKKDMEIMSLQLRQDSRKEEVKDKEKDLEVSLLKQQMTVFMQDFEKEKREKQTYREKLHTKEQDYEKLKIKCEQKVKSLKTELQRTNEDLRVKAQDADILQKRVAHLINELSEHRRKPQGSSELSPIEQTPSSITNSAASIVYPSNAGRPKSSLLNSSFAIGPRRIPEEVPGAWTCSDCTYINFPDRTVCDVCGLQRFHDSSMSGFERFQAGLHAPSTFEKTNRGRNVPDNIDETIEEDDI